MFVAVNLFDTFDSRPPNPDSHSNDVGVVLIFWLELLMLPFIVLVLTALTTVQEPGKSERVVMAGAARVERVDTFGRSITVRTDQGVSHTVYVGPELSVFEPVASRRHGDAPGGRIGDRRVEAWSEAHGIERYDRRGPQGERRPKRCPAAAQGRRDRSNPSTSRRRSSSMSWETIAASCATRWIRISSRA